MQQAEGWVDVKRHYHVLEGLEGLYMPDSNYVCATRREAELLAATIAAEAKDDQAQSEEYKPRAEWELRMDEVPWHGSARAGYYTNGICRIEINICYEADCVVASD